MKIIFTILIIALLVVLVFAAIKIIGILLKSAIWVAIVVIIVILINYILLPRIGRIPFKLGLEKIYKTESIKTKEQIKKVEKQKDKILKTIVTKSRK
ncbi:MAG: hypothetical protein PHE88_08235 [Elusimicrobia bacterium]|nr:hypothetical protein [Elusimicrobiota bacterium]